MTDNETEALAEQPAEQRPQNCGTGFCSCIECPYGQPAEQKDSKEEDMPEPDDIIFIRYQDLHDLLTSNHAKSAKIEELEWMLDSIGAGGVGPVIITH